MTNTLAFATSNFITAQVRELVEILDETIANGAASLDTRTTYQSQIKQFFSWCQHVGCAPLEITTRRIEQYRRYLVLKGLKVTTIALKLTVVRRLYDVAVKQGLINFNPALDVKPPPARKQIGYSNNYLSQEEAQKLISTLPNDDSLSGLRDRLLVSLMVICGVRQIELHRLTIGDIERRSDGKVGLNLYAKRSERTIPLTPQLIQLLDRYLEARRKAGHKTNNKSTPVFISLASNHYGEPLTRRTMQIIVNNYLEQAKLKESCERTVTTHGLRHTVGYLMTLAGNSLRVIQDYLGHADPRTTAIYAHIANLWENNPAMTINLVV